MTHRGKRGTNTTNMCRIWRLALGLSQRTTLGLPFMSECPTVRLSKLGLLRLDCSMIDVVPSFILFCWYTMCWISTLEL